MKRGLKPESFIHAQRGPKGPLFHLFHLLARAANLVFDGRDRIADFRFLISDFLVCQELLRQPELQPALLGLGYFQEANAQIATMIAPDDFCLGFQS